jgi:hypothetical protein
MTSSTAPEFSIEIWDDDGQLIASTRPTWDLSGVRGHLARIQRVYPHARMTMRDHDTAEWRDASDVDLDRIAYRSALAVLDSMSLTDLPLLTWSLSVTDGTAQADAWVPGDPANLDVLHAYAAYLDTEVAPHGNNFLRVSSIAAGVQVRVSMAKPDRAEVAA